MEERKQLPTLGLRIYLNELKKYSMETTSKEKLIRYLSGLSMNESCSSLFASFKDELERKNYRRSYLILDDLVKGLNLYDNKIKSLKEEFYWEYAN